MSLYQYYSILKQSPLAKSKEETSIEEVAIWIDLNNGSSQAGVMKIFKAIDENYHHAIIDKMCSMPNAWKRLTSSTPCKSTKSMAVPYSAQTLKFQCFSDNILYWMFKLCTETSIFDHAILDKKFISFAESIRDKHKKNAKQKKTVGSLSFPIISIVDQELYEIFAELVDIVEKKMQNAN